MNTKILDVVRKFNDGWINKQFDAIRELMHDDVVFISPNFQSAIHGRQACIDTLQEYTSMASTNAFEVNDEQVYQWNDIATVTFQYLIEYELNAQVFLEKGIEIWQLQSLDNIWMLVCRSLAKTSNAV